MANTRDVVLQRLEKRKKAGLDEYQPAEAPEAEVRTDTEGQVQGEELQGQVGVSESAADTTQDEVVAAPMGEDAQAAAPEGGGAPTESKPKPARKRSQGKARGKGSSSSRTKSPKAPKAEEKPAPQQSAPPQPAVGEALDLGLGRSLPPFEELPDVVRLEDDLFVRDEGKLLPAEAQVKMTFTMSVRERHRMREYARLNRVSYVDVFRAGVQLVLGDEEE